MQEILEKAGLSKNESRVYLSLLDLGLTSSKAIIEKTGLHRQLVYDSLNKLTERGLVSFVVQANRKYFKASNPKEFLETFNNKIERIEKQKLEFEKILPQLTAKREQSSEKQETTVYSGNKGIKSLLDDMLNQKEEILTIGASEIEAEAFQYHLNFNLPKFHKFREQKKIHYKILLSEDLKQRAKELNKLKNTQSKILQREFTSNSSINIYGDKISIILWGSSPFGILISSKEIAESQRKHFNLLWNIAKNLK
jgi:sugar-specific transcriptional regulator TrmB